jgi:mRNA interferase MazF
MVMKRGELYLVTDPAGDPKRQRVFVVVSHQGLIDSRYSTVVCAPVYSRGEGLGTQLAVGLQEGLKHESWIMCDNLVSIRKAQLTRFVGSLSVAKMHKLNNCLAVALDLPIEVQ